MLSKCVFKAGYFNEHTLLKLKDNETELNVMAKENERVPSRNAGLKSKHLCRPSFIQATYFYRLPVMTFALLEPFTSTS